MDYASSAPKQLLKQPRTNKALVAEPNSLPFHTSKMPQSHSGCCDKMPFRAQLEPAVHTETHEQRLLKQSSGHLKADTKWVFGQASRESNIAVSGLWQTKQEVPQSNAPER
jgi:hypothetical protein